MCALWVALTNRSVNDYDPSLDVIDRLREQLDLFQRLADARHADEVSVREDEFVVVRRPHCADEDCDLPDGHSGPHTAWEPE